MKSAYEIAMERLEKEHGPARKLTDDQKARIAEIDRRFDAKIAEAKLGFESKLKQAATADDLAKLQGELAESINLLEGQRETEKQAVWGEA
jgi:hypothetical protein